MVFHSLFLPHIASKAKVNPTCIWGVFGFGLETELGNRGRVAFGVSRKPSLSADVSDKS